MSSVLKIVVCTVITVAIVGVSGGNPVAARRIDARQATSSPKLQTAGSVFQPDPSPPPIVTQGSGTR